MMLNMSSNTKSIVYHASNLLVIVFTILLSITNFSCDESETPEEPIDSFTVTFDTNGGIPTPASQTLIAGEFANQPTVIPNNVDSIFIGWYSLSNIEFDFENTPINKDITLHAKWWLSPEQYIALSTGDGDSFAKDINELFGSFIGKQVAVANAPLFRLFERDMNTFVPRMENQLREAEMYNVPIMIFLSVLPFTNARPDLYNWWDQNASGYNPDNVNNVEWYGWDESKAVKIGWLNWGSQMRLPPMPNIMSPTFQNAEKDAIVTLMTIVKNWYDQLPENKKYLFAGIRSTDEMAIGVNNWYYPNGNDYLDQDKSNDPTTGLDVYDLPSRGVQTIGYNAVRTVGIKSSGEITIEDLNEVCRLHGEFLSKIYYDMGFPREKIFASSFGKTVGECKTCFNQYACPSWSFYHSYAANPTKFTEAFEALESSDAPAWAMMEWGIPRTQPDSKVWETNLRTGLALEGNKIIRITGGLVVSAKHGTNMPAVEAIQKILR